MSVMAEWWALRDGLNLAIHLGINQLEVELDAKVIVEKLKSTNCPNRSFATLLCDCRCLMARFRQVQVGHVFREVNKCVDFLAKRGCSLMENSVVFDISPFDDLNVLLKADRNGLYYYRRVANTLASVAIL
ncbi:putative ribonuclease h protein [Quercus suber]|uniref:Ribonuclease h protein n=1 Tax=Quercus suber TaxID=58331 RepID=A0AAW0IRZ0_QUESU